MQGKEVLKISFLKLNRKNRDFHIKI